MGFLATPVSRLLPAKAALTREAEKYYQHEVKFGDPRAVEVWRWDGKQVTLTALPATKVEEYYGLKFARQALQLDPAYRPAQLVLLSLVLDKTYERAGLAEPLAKSAPAVHDMLATTSPDLLLAVLERGLAEKHTPLVLGAIRTLGGLSEVRAGRPEAAGPGPFARALNYPDRRVQFAAAEALLNTPAPASSQQTTRIVDVLRRALAAEPAAKGVPRVLVAYFTPELANRVSDAVRTAGYEPVAVHTGRELMRRLNGSADIDLILMDEDLPDPGLTTLLPQLQADRNAGQIPILLAASLRERQDRMRREFARKTESAREPALAREHEEKLRRQVQFYKHVTVIPAGFAFNSEDLEVLFGQRTSNPKSAPLTEAEMKYYGERAMVWLGRLARGDIQGFDVRPALDVVAGALRRTLAAGRTAGRRTGPVPVAWPQAAGRAGQRGAGRQECGGRPPGRDHGADPPYPEAQPDVVARGGRQPDGAASQPGHRPQPAGQPGSARRHVPARRTHGRRTLAALSTREPPGAAVAAAAQGQGQLRPLGRYGPRVQKHGFKQTHPNEPVRGARTHEPVAGCLNRLQRPGPYRRRLHDACTQGGPKWRLRTSHAARRMRAKDLR